MSQVVRNENSHDYHIPGRSNQGVIAPGETVVLTEDEFSRIPFDERGAGKVYPVWPNEASGETLQQKLDYYIPGGASNYTVEYIGMARQSGTTADEVWTIRRFAHAIFGGEAKVTEIQVLEGVAWDDRAILPWT